MSSRAAIIAQLKAGKVVWFGSDVGHYGERTMGIWDDNSFDFAALTGLPLAMDKTDALDYGLAAMNHAMVLTGVNLDEAGKPTRWKIENSWGDKNGEKGYYVCSDSWFDQYVFQAAVEKEHLGDLVKPGRSWNRLSLSRGIRWARWRVKGLNNKAFFSNFFNFTVL